ncbi:unnamed protein product [Ixodes pacificus]
MIGKELKHDWGCTCDKQKQTRRKWHRHPLGTAPYHRERAAPTVSTSERRRQRQKA